MPITTTKEALEFLTAVKSSHENAREEVPENVKNRIKELEAQLKEEEQQLKDLQKTRRGKKFIKKGSIIQSVDPEDIDFQILDKLDVGIYTLNANPALGLYLTKTCDQYDLPPKLYGDVGSQAQRILNTFHSRPNSTGVLLSGEKGCGKTLLAKVIANYSKLPVILVNSAYCGDSFNSFVHSIQQEAIFLFDEYEKVYRDHERQDMLLSLLDGMFPSKKLFILTVNEYRAVNNKMLNRPGRLFYKLDYDGLDKDFILEYSEDNLKDPSKAPTVVTASTFVRKFNFDMLQSLVEEMNRYDESAKDALKMMNIITSSYTDRFQVSLTCNGNPVYEIDEDHQIIMVNPFEIFRTDFYATQEDKQNDVDYSLYWSADHIVKVDKGEYTFQQEVEGKLYKLQLKPHYSYTKKVTDFF